MSKEKKGIQKRIFSSLLIVGILPGILVIVLMFVGGKNTLEQANGVHLAKVAEETSEKIQLFLQYKTQANQKEVPLLKMKDFREMITNVHIGSTGFAQLIDGEGKIIIHPKSDQVNKRLASSIYQEMKKENKGWVWSKDNGAVKHYQLGFSPIPKLPQSLGLDPSKNWYVLVSQDSKEGLSPLYALLWKASLFGAAMILVLSLVELNRAHKIVKPIEELQKGGFDHWTWRFVASNQHQNR